MELETRQLNIMAEKLRIDEWHIQIYSKEYTYNFQRFVFFEKTFLIF